MELTLLARSLSRQLLQPERLVRELRGSSFSSFIKIKNNNLSQFRLEIEK